MRVARPRLAASAGVVQAGLGHLVDPVVLAGDELAADRADAAPAAHVDPGLGYPVRPVFLLLDIGHALFERPRRILDEQLLRKPGQVEMAVSRDAAVLHGALHNGLCRSVKRFPGRRPRYFGIAARARGRTFG